MTPVTAIVAAFDRLAQTLEALRRIRGCSPAPAEILVHVDADRREVADAVTASGLADRVFLSPAQVGPGGGRNRLIREARHAIVASFDDDSWPMDEDYFGRLVTLFERHREAAVIGARIFERGRPREAAIDRATWVADFVGAGCAYRRDAFLATDGYVPLATAYGMEEVDLALRLHAAGHRILHSDWLRVEHDTTLAHHASAPVTAASITNIVLLTYLRYPVALWGVGALQALRRIAWLLGHRRWRGVLRGITAIPASVRRHASLRSPLPRPAVLSYLVLRRGGSAMPASHG
jgi:GT2 family glycosyltransferase